MSNNDDNLVNLVTKTVSSLINEEVEIMHSLSDIDLKILVKDIFNGVDPLRNIKESEAEGKLEVIPIITTICSMASVVISLAKLYLDAIKRDKEPSAVKNYIFINAGDVIVSREEAEKIITEFERINLSD